MTHPPQVPTPTEAEVRALRAAVYGECSDSHWEAVKDRCMTPWNIETLRRAAARETKP